MAPARIKYYGLLPLTRRGYLVLIALADVLAVALVVRIAAAGLLPPLSTLWGEGWAQGSGAWVYNTLYWFILAALVAEVIDIVTVLRRFAQKEAEQRAQPTEIEQEQPETSNL
jgi:hypothetical protein